MKKFKNKQEPNLYEIIMPFGEGLASGKELFDDCPICLEIKRKMKSGELEDISDLDSDERN